MDPDVQVLGTAGPPVLLLPGAGASCDGFYPGFVEGLGAGPGCRVIVHDLPGWGDSREPADLAEASNHLHSLVENLGLGPVVVVGQSLGGAVAMLFARDFSTDVAGMVLFDSTPINDTRLCAFAERGYGGIARLCQIPAFQAGFSRLSQLMTSRMLRHADLREDCAEVIRRIGGESDFRQIGNVISGVTAVSTGFDTSSLPRVPAFVGTADRPARSRIRAAHQAIADHLGVPLTSWPGSSHTMHLGHPERSLAAAREIIRRSER